MTRIIMIVAIFGSLALAGDADKLLDTRAQAAKVRYEKALEDAKTAYQAAVAKAEADYIVELESAIKQATKAERFEVAKALLAEKDAIEAATPTGPPPRNSMVGRWELKGHPGVWVEFHANGDVRTFAADDAGVWRANPNGSISTAYGPQSLQTFTANGNTAMSQRGSETREWSKIK